MCRAGGHRCKGSHASSRTTQNTRQQRSRARRALKKAKASGDADAIRKATERLDTANAAHQSAKEKAMHRNDSADQPRDVTNIVGGDVIGGAQTGNIDGGISFGPGGVTIGGVPADQYRDVTPSAPSGAGPRSRVTNIVGGNVIGGVQAGAITGGISFGPGGMTIGGNPAGHRPPPPRPPRRPTPAQPSTPGAGGTGPVTITDANGRPLLQAGRVNGGIWVDGKRVG